MITGCGEGFVLIAVQKRINQAQVFNDRRSIAAPLVLFIPLIVVVENQRNHPLKLRRKAVFDHASQRVVKALVQQ